MDMYSNHVPPPHVKFCSIEVKNKITLNLLYLTASVFSIPRVALKIVQRNALNGESACLSYLEQEVARRGLCSVPKGIR